MKFHLSFLVARPLFWRCALLALIAFCGSLALQPARAQAAADAAAPVEAKANDVHLTDMLAKGGIVIYILGAVSVLEVFFIVEGFYFQRLTMLAPKVLVARLRESITSGNYQEAWNICKSNRSFISSVTASGLERIGRGRDAVEFAIEESALRESTILKTNTTYLSVIGVVSPMIGLFGTVIGMIKAFQQLGASGISDPSGLAAAIGEVLVATAAGLFVAIPAFIFFYVLRALAQTAILRAEEQVFGLVDSIPFDQLTGIRIGENFSADDVSPAKGKSVTSRSTVSQRVSPKATTNCPSCNAPISVGATPCPNCGTVLDWGT